MFLIHRAAAKTAAEISVAASAEKKVAKSAVISPGRSPPATRTRSKANLASAQKKPESAQAEAEPKAAVAEVKTAGKGKAAGKAAGGGAGKKAPVKAGVDDEIQLPAVPDAMSDSDDEVDDGPAQRLVVKLDQKQQKKLSDGLGKLKTTKKESAPTGR